MCSDLYRQGTRAFKAKVGRGQQYDRTRALSEDRLMLNAIRESTGPDAQLLTDANQNLGDWRNAAAYMMELAEYKPLYGAQMMKDYPALMAPPASASAAMSSATPDDGRGSLQRLATLMGTPPAAPVPAR